MISVVMALWVRNLRVFVRNKPALFFSLVLPFFFVFVFSRIFGSASLMLAGIIITTVFDASLRISSNTIDDMTGGFMKEVLVSPVPRVAIALGQFASSATVGTAQGLLIYLIGFFIGLRPDSVVTVAVAVALMIFVGFTFAGFGLLLASKARNMQTFQAMSMAITMPMTFISGAYIPLSALPIPLQWVGRFNPMTYAVHFFRNAIMDIRDEHVEALLAAEQEILRFGALTVTPALAVAILAVFGAAFLCLSTMTFSRLDFSKMNRNKGDADSFWG